MFVSLRATTVSRRLLTGTLVVLFVLMNLLGPGTSAAEASTGNAKVREAQRLLSALGYPVGAVDGVDGPRTRQGLCAWRSLEKRGAHRGSLKNSELKALRTTTRLPRASAGRGVTIDRTCQTVYFRNHGKWKQVLITSTGADGREPAVGTYKVQRKRAGWHTSTLYPSDTPNMYNTIYFNGPIALHGSRDVPARPASKGCARLTVKGADYLFARLKVGDKVKVVGAW